MYKWYPGHLWVAYWTKALPFSGHRSTVSGFRYVIFWVASSPLWTDDFEMTGSEWGLALSAPNV